MMKVHPRPYSILIFLFVLLGCANDLYSQEPPKGELEKAIAVLRSIEPSKLTEEQQRTKSEEIDSAWQTITDSGDEGLEALKKEVAVTDSAEVRDDFFRLNASALLWSIGKFEEVDTIAKIWNSTPLSVQYTYVFLTALDAAKTQDRRVIPMLRAILKDSSGSIYIGSHAMNVSFPLSHEFIWGSFGPAGLPILDEILRTSKNEAELISAMDQLARAQYLPSLETIRKVAKDGKVAVRQKAIQSLGIYGHPDDYEFLVSQVQASDPLDLFSVAFALYEFDDERAVKHLIPLLDSSEVTFVQREVSLALLHLLTPEAFTAVRDFVERTDDPELKEFLTRSITLRREKLPKGFDNLSVKQQEIELSKIKNQDLMVDPERGPFKAEQLRPALKVWKEKGRIYGSGVDWVGEGNMIAVAVPEDINAILETKARFYHRLSDECLYEVRDFDEVIKHVGRSRYRKGLGVTKTAELK